MTATNVIRFHPVGVVADSTASEKRQEAKLQKKRLDRARDIKYALKDIRDEMQAMSKHIAVVECNVERLRQELESERKFLAAASDTHASLSKAVETMLESIEEELSDEPSWETSSAFD